MTKTSLLVALAGLFLCSAGTQAASFNFSGSTDSGPLSATPFTGTFSYADIGIPTDGEAALTAFTLSFAGQSYTLASATATATAVFSAGSFVGLSYLDDASINTALRPQVAFTPGLLGLSDAYLAYVGDGGQGGFGSYTVSVVPEPAALALWLGGAVFLNVLGRRRR